MPFLLSEQCILKQLLVLQKIVKVKLIKLLFVLKYVCTKFYWFHVVLLTVRAKYILFKILINFLVLKKISCNRRGHLHILWNVQQRWASILWVVQQRWAPILWIVLQRCASILWFVQQRWESIIWIVQQRWASILWIV